MSNLDNQNNTSADTLLYLFSMNSKYCIDLQKQYFTAIHKDYIHPICIDNPEIRNIIVNSDSIRINNVPCFLVISNNNVSIYESDDAFSWIAEFNHKLKSSQESQSSQGYHNDQPSPDQKRSEIADDLLNKENIFGNEKENSSTQDNPKSFLKSALKNSSKTNLTTQDIPISILKTPKEPKKVTIGEGKYVKIIQDLTEFENEDNDVDENNSVNLDEDPSGMNISRETEFDKGGSQTNSKGSSHVQENVNASSASIKKANDLKKMAEEMASARSNYDEQFNKDTNGVVNNRPQDPDIY
jgi:hypothetical protein